MPVSFGMAHLHMTIINIHIITYKYTTSSIAPRLRFDEPNRNPLVMAVIQCKRWSLKGYPTHLKGNIAELT